MDKNRINEDYRRHKLLSALHKGVYKGRCWNWDGDLLLEISGKGINEVLIALKDFVDSSFIQIANSRESAPEVSEYVRAFQRILVGLPDSYLAMLKAHFLAPNQTMTATELAIAGNYKNWSSANLHYGSLGKRLYEELPIRLPTRADGTLIFTCALATEDNLNQAEGPWEWKMRPEVAAAIKQMGLFN
jgi:hypothetical protein